VNPLRDLLRSYPSALIQAMPDPFYNDIVAALNERLDPEVFERCAADLLREIYPGLVPVRGGSDSGMDGAVADGKGPPFPLVSTTTDQITRNLRGSLRSYRAAGGTRNQAVLATSRPLTPKRRANLFKIAQDEGFRLVQIHEQAAFADLLYRSPGWCRELLDLTGQPPALSAVPLTSRPLMGDVLVARGPDLEWISQQAGDALLVGQPGAGKTYILRELAKVGTGLFVVSEDRGELAAAIRAQAPTVLFVDDAHHRRDLLLQLRHLREELGAEFRLLATCWPGEQLEVAKTLGLAKSAIRELELLTRKEIAEVIRGCGIAGPRPLLRELIEQAEGRPGLAVTLCYLCRRDGVRDVASGTALFEDVRQTFQQLVGREAIEILAGFAVGGDRGMTMEAVAGALGFRLVELRHTVERLAAGGVLGERYDRSLLVQPEALRHALVSAVFFSGATSLPIQDLLSVVRVPRAVALTLTGARRRGARVPDELIQGLLRSTSDAQAWKAYASLGAGESRWVLEHRPDLLTEVAWIVLHTVPELAIPRLLVRAVGDDRPLHAHPEHPLRQLHDWVKGAVPGGGEVLAHRKALLDALLSWHASGEVDSVVSLRALAMVFEPSFEGLESDPVDLMGMTLRYGGLLEEEIARIKALWPRAVPLLRACGLAEWAPIRELIRDWAHPGMSTHGHLAPESYEQMHGLAQQIMADVLTVSEGHPGVVSWITGLARRKGWDTPAALDPAFEVLFPQRDHEDLRAGATRQLGAATALADGWAADAPVAVADRLAKYSAQAASVDHRWPDWSGHVARRLAELASEPIVWARAMIAADNAYQVIEPFLRRVFRDQFADSEALWNECFEIPGLRGMAILAALTEPAVPEPLVERALEDVAGLSEAIGTACLRNEIPEYRLPRLLRHPNMTLVEEIASAMWHRDPVGSIPEELRADWRRIVVDHLEEDHTLKAIFASDPSIAFEWLAGRVGRANNTVHAWHEDEPYATAIGLMNREQRQQLVEMVTPETWPCEIVSLLVGRDPELYQLVLNRSDLPSHHLEPLRGEPQSDWIPLARLALEAGYGAEEVAGATRGMMWEWDGQESDMWSRWAELFRPLAAAPDADIRSIGQAGLEEAEEHLRNAQKTEKREAAFGR
jgi:hypothetical protein